MGSEGLGMLRSHGGWGTAGGWDNSRVRGGSRHGDLMVEWIGIYLNNVIESLKFDLSEMV